MLDKYMQELGKEMGLDGSFASEVPGVFQFPIDDEVSVTISEIAGGFTMSSVIGECPEEEQEFFTQALIANLFAEGTEGAVLGLDSEGKQLTLSRIIDYNVEYKEFRDVIEDFLNAVDFWRDEVKAYGTKLG